MADDGPRRPKYPGAIVENQQRAMRPSSRTLLAANNPLFLTNFHPSSGVDRNGQNLGSLSRN